MRALKACVRGAIMITSTIPHCAGRGQTGSVKLVQHYLKEIPVILFSLSIRISDITDRHSVRFSSRVSES